MRGGQQARTPRAHEQHSRALATLRVSATAAALALVTTAGVRAKRWTPRAPVGVTWGPPHGCVRSIHNGSAVAAHTSESHHAPGGLQETAGVRASKTDYEATSGTGRASRRSVTHFSRDSQCTAGARALLRPLLASRSDAHLYQTKSPRRLSGGRATSSHGAQPWHDAQSSYCWRRSSSPSRRREFACSRVVGSAGVLKRRWQRKQRLRSSLGCGAVLGSCFSIRGQGGQRAAPDDITSPAPGERESRQHEGVAPRARSHL